MWDWSAHADLMAATWRAAIVAQREYEMIWSVSECACETATTAVPVCRLTAAQASERRGRRHLPGVLVTPSRHVTRAAVPSPLRVLRRQTNRAAAPARRAVS